MRPIYLDYMASTPLDPQVIAKMKDCLENQNDLGNAAARHFYGDRNSQLIEHARQQVADLVRADANEIIWTSGATESNNLAIKGAALFYARKGKHLITMTTEHKSVLECFQYLETQGFEVTYLNPEESGLLDFQKLIRAIRSDTILVSIMHVNNETGVIQDIKTIGELLRNKGIIFHVDAAQSAGKININLKQLNIDLMSFSAHKIYGPKGIGALYIRPQPKVRLAVQMHGGGQEKNIRSGTLPTHQIVGMGEAFSLARNNLIQESYRLAQLKKYFWNELSKNDDVFLNGDFEQSIPSCINIRFKNINNDALISRLKDVAVSSGSACNEVSDYPSPVLKAMGLSDQEANQSIRISFGRFTTDVELQKTLDLLKNAIHYFKNRLPKDCAQEETIEFYFTIDNQKIIQAEFKAKGRASVFNSADKICNYLNNKPYNELRNLNPEKISQLLKLPAKQVHIATLIHRAIEGSV